MHVREDLDADGVEELFLHNATVQAVISLDGSASVREFDSYRLRHNFGDVLSRHAESYRRKLQAGESHAAASGGIASAHDRVSFKDTITPADLVLDEVLKTLFRDTLFRSHVGYEAFVPRYELASEGDNNIIFNARTYGGALYKEFHLERNALTVSYSFDAQLSGLLQIELPIAMPSCDGPAGRYWYRGDCPGGFGSPLALQELTEITLEDDVLGGYLLLRASHPVSFSARPFMTVSQSEAGFEKIMQAVTVFLVFAFPRQADTLKLTIEVNPKADDNG
jgi:4-alpha-glucanotransferase